MRFSCRKGQGSTDYLMTYGWAIFAIFVVVVVLWQFGVFDTNKGVTTSVGLKAIKPHLSLVSFDEKGVFSGVFLNGAGAPVTITGVALKDIRTDQWICCSHAELLDDSGVACGKDSASDIGGYVSSQFNNTANPSTSTVGPRIDKGNNVVIELGDVPSPTDKCILPLMEMGKEFNLRIDIYYNVRIGSAVIPRKDSGTFLGKIM